MEPSKQTHMAGIYDAYHALARGKASSHTPPQSPQQSPGGSCYNSHCPDAEMELGQVRRLAPDTAGKRWNSNSDPGFSDPKACVP